MHRRYPLVRGSEAIVINRPGAMHAGRRRTSDARVVQAAFGCSQLPHPSPAGGWPGSSFLSVNQFRDAPDEPFERLTAGEPATADDDALEADAPPAVHDPSIDGGDVQRVPTPPWEDPASVVEGDKVFVEEVDHV